MTKLSGLKKENFLSHRYGEQKLEIKMLAALVPSEAVRKGSISGPFPSTWHLLPTSGVCESLTPISAFTFTWLSPGVSVCVQISPFYRDANHIGLGVHSTG